MQRVFEEQKLKELKKLFNTKKYTKTELAQRYKCSVTTVCLWLNEDQRIIFNKIHAQTLKRNQCDCGELISKHKRCNRCTMLIHKEDMCKWCEEEYLNNYGRN